MSDVKMMPALGPVRLGELPGWPVVGKLLDFRRDSLSVHREANRAGDLTRVRLGKRRIWMVTRPDLAYELLVDRADACGKAPGLAVYGKLILGEGLLTTDGDRHRRQRKLLAPAFAHKRIASYGKIMVELAETTAARWRPGQTFDVVDEMMRVTLAIVGKTLFDADIERDAPVVGGAIVDLLEFIAGSFGLPLPVDWPLPRNLRMRSSVAKLDEIVYRLIDERHRAPGDRGDVLSTLLEARDDDGSGLDDKTVRDEIMTLMLAGHETTANAMSWVWFLLSQHPAAADRLHDELDAVLGGRSPTIEDLPRLPWTRQVVDEAMRLYPPAYSIGRTVQRAFPLGPVTIEAGQVVIVPIHVLHRRADCWDEPDQFRPERFAEAARARHIKGAYLPFGGGPRICIGNHFALMEAQLLLATLAQRWHLRLAQPPESVVPQPMVTLRPRGGLRMQARPRVAAPVARAAAAP